MQMLKKTFLIILGMMKCQGLMEKCWNMWRPEMRPGRLWIRQQNYHTFNIPNICRNILKSVVWNRLYFKSCWIGNKRKMRRCVWRSVRAVSPSRWTTRVSALRVLKGYQPFSDMSDLLFHHPGVIGLLTVQSWDNASYWQPRLPPLNCIPPSP